MADLPGQAQPRQAGAEPGDRALLLQSSRRLDWRFLLPRPQLGRTVYIGRPDATLLGALRAHTDLTVAAASTALPPSSFDLAVLKDPPPESVRTGHDLVRPGGWVYAEVGGGLRRHGAALVGARPLRRWCRAFADAGLTEVAAYWHVPGHHTAAFLVPLADRGGVRLVLGRHQGSAAGRAKASIGRLLLTVGLVELAVRDASVLGHRPAPDQERS
jgi:hypothetical protein